MATFTVESLEQLRQQINLIDVLSAHVELKKTGACYKGLCPFHDEKTPSFMVRVGDRHYHCFGCGAHGDAITFLMERLHLSFQEAVESLAERFGISLQRAVGEDRAEVARKQLRQTVRDATRFYHFALLNLQEADEALQYLFGRGIGLDFIRRFELGYAPASKGFRSVMERLGHGSQCLKEAGLLNSKGSEFFFDRILFPIKDPVGNPLGFSARRYREGATGGKYINTPETVLFRKGEILFGLHESRRRIARERRVILVEGQLDCLRLIDCGLDFAVAPLGTALGEGHVQLLVQLGVRDVWIAFDADAPGQEAAAKAGDLLLRQGIGASVIVLPSGADPDSFILKEGPEKMMQALAESRDYISFLVKHRSEKIDSSSATGKGELAREISQRIRQWPDPVIVHESLRRLARVLDLPEEMIGVSQRPVAAFQISHTARLDGMRIGEEEDVLEADVLRWLVLMGDRQPQVVELARLHLDSLAFHSEIYRYLFEQYLKLSEETEERDLMTVATRLQKPQAQQALATILKRRINRERVQVLYPEAITRLLERNWMLRREQIRQRIQSGALPDEEVMALIKEFDSLKGQRPVAQWPT